MKLSIIVPVYNMAADGKLAFCLDSLVNQTITDYEIIAVDDKSTDNSLEILKAYEKNYPDKVRVIASPENRRQGGAKNLGLRAVKGEWVGFIDSDDWVTPDFYEKLFAEAERTGADVVGCNYNITYEHSFVPGKPARSNHPGQAGILDEEHKRELILNPGSMVPKIYKYSIFYDNGLWFPEGMFYEDNCLGPLTLLYAKRFAYVDEANYFYYQHSASTVHHISVEKCNDRLTTMEYFMGECYKRGFLEEFPEEIEYRFTEIFYINTLFTYMLGVPFTKRRISYVKALRDGIMAYFPEFDTNPYFYEKQDAEVKKLTKMHCKNPAYFFWYYTLLTTYRKLRKAISRKK
ncbi:MAG: glycosyltransferase [Lachnospiraceae bacterium]|nr:glycosyltransferase [Lachnospiraceae bacterium]